MPWQRPDKPTNSREQIPQHRSRLRRTALRARCVLAMRGLRRAAAPPTAPSTAATGRRGGTLTKVKLQLQWFTQAQFAGYFAASSRASTRTQGLDVQILEGGVDIVPQTVLAQGKADYAIAWVPKALPSREQGAGITDVGQIFQRSGTLPGVLQGQGHHHRRPTSRARRSATGASATSSSCSPA